MQRVFVLDKNKQPLMPCHPARARKLLKLERASVFKRYPFTIILKDREGGDTQPVQVKYDPGAKTTGIAIVAAFQRGNCCVWAAELEHRGWAVRDALLKRRQLRRGRRSRKARYRQPRFLNRTKPKGWLPPSLMSRVQNIDTWTHRLMKAIPVTHLAMELVRFDTQKMDNSEITGVEYQQGELAGYEVREYLLEKWGRKCAYCGAENVPLEVEHITPKSRGGSNRVSNLTLACTPCNQKKVNQTASEFGYPEIQAKAKKPLNGAAAMNATRWKVYETLQRFDLPVEVGTGGRTKYNRTQQGYPKTHWLDAVCVGESGVGVFVHSTIQPLLIQAKGHGSRQMCGTDRYGFPMRHRTRQKTFFRFQTGDMVRAVVQSGKKQGIYTGRVLCRKTGRFDIRTSSERVQGISYRSCTHLHQSDGYTYTKGDSAFLYGG